MPVAVLIEAQVVSVGFPLPSARGHGHGIAIFASAAARDVEVLARSGVGAVLDGVDFGAGG